MQIKPEGEKKNTRKYIYILFSDLLLVIIKKFKCFRVSVPLKSLFISWGKWGDLRRILKEESLGEETAESWTVTWLQEWRE